VGPEGLEGGVALEPGEKVVVAVFELLAVDGGFLAAVYEDELRVPAVEVFDHPAVLEVVELGDTVGGDDVAGGVAGAWGFGAEDGGEKPEVVGALGPGEVEALDGHHGGFDGGGEDGDGGSGGERGEEGGVGYGGVCEDGSVGAVGRDGEAGEGRGEHEGQEAEGGGCGDGAARRSDGSCGEDVEELKGEGDAEEADCGELLVVPAGALEEIGERGAAGGGDEQEDDGTSGGRADVEGEDEGGEQDELDGLPEQGEEGEVADGPVGVVQDGQGGGEVEGREAADGEEEGCSEREDEEGLGAKEALQAGGEVGCGEREQGELYGDDEEGVVGFETDACGGEEGGEAAGEGEFVFAEGDGCGEDVGQDEEGEHLVALAEVACRDDVEEDDGGEEQGGELVVAERRAGAAEEVEAEESGGCLGQRDEGLCDEGGGEVERLGEEVGEGGEPDDAGGVGVEDLGAVDGGSREPAMGHEEEPELVVACGWEQSEERGHPCSGEDEEQEDAAQGRVGCGVHGLGFILAGVEVGFVQL
jgi:hypothetical protein